MQGSNAPFEREGKVLSTTQKAVLFGLPLLRGPLQIALAWLHKGEVPVFEIPAFFSPFPPQRSVAPF